MQDKTVHKNTMEQKIGGELEKVACLPAWGILIDGQTSLDPAYIRNESLINKFHFSEKFLVFNFSNSKFIFLLLWAIERERCQMWHLRISPLTDFIANTGRCIKSVQNPKIKFDYFSTQQWLHCKHKHWKCLNYKPIYNVHTLHKARDSKRSTQRTQELFREKFEVSNSLVGDMRSSAIQFTLDFRVHKEFLKQ